VSALLRRGLVAGWAVSVAVLLLQTLHKASRPQGSDLFAYLTAARALLAGQDPYVIQGRFYYMYPLPVAVFALPLTLLPWKVAVALWFLLSVAALVWAGGVLAGLAREHLGLGPEVPRAALGAALWFLLFDPIQSDLVNGQVNFQLLLLDLLFLRALLRGRTARAAGFLAVAVSIKITPALLLLFATARRRWAAIAGCLLATLALWLGPVILIGPDLLLRSYGTLLGHILPSAAGGHFAAPHGVAFGLHGPLATLLGPRLGPLGVRALAIALSLGALLTLELGARRRPSAGRDVWVFAGYLLIILLATPFSEVHHLTYLVPAMGLVGLLAVCRRDRVGGRAAVGLAAAGALVWGGYFARSGPFAFLAVVLLLGLVGAAVLGRQEPALAGPAPKT
jgi:hypothetical protein